MELRPATLNDLALIRRWDEQEHVVAANPNDFSAWEVELAQSHCWREQLIAEVNGHPIGFIQIIVDPLETNVRAHRFYERLGFRFVERRHFGRDECFVYRLERAGYAASTTGMLKG